MTWSSSNKKKRHPISINIFCETLPLCSIFIFSFVLELKQANLYLLHHGIAALAVFDMETARSVVGHVFQARLNHLTDGIWKDESHASRCSKKSEMVKYIFLWIIIDSISIFNLYYLNLINTPPGHHQIYKLYKLYNLNCTAILSPTKKTTIAWYYTTKSFLKPLNISTITQLPCLSAMGRLRRWRLPKNPQQRSPRK